MRRSLLFRSIILIVPLTLLVLWLGGFFHSKVKPGNLEANTTVLSGVSTLTVGSSETPQFLTVSGTIWPMETAQISAKVMAQITSIHVKEGDKVGSGAALATLDRRDAVAQAGQAAAQVSQAGVAFDQTGINLNRIKQLFEAGAAPKADLDAAQTSYDMARAAYEAAHAGYDLSQVNIGYGTITAPFAGLVAKKLVDAGNMASPGTPLLVLERPPYRLEVNLDESLAQKINKGMKVGVRIDSFSKELEGSVDEILPTVDVATRTFTAKIALPEDLDLRSGMFGSARFNISQVDRILVPASAITRWSQFTGVYAVDEQSLAHLRLVRLGETFGDQVEVLSGLNPGDRILTENLDKVKDGCRVEVAQ